MNTLRGEGHCVPEHLYLCFCTCLVDSGWAAVMISASLGFHWHVIDTKSYRDRKLQELCVYCPLYSHLVSKKFMHSYGQFCIAVLACLS